MRLKVWGHYFTCLSQLMLAFAVSGCEFPGLSSTSGQFSKTIPTAPGSNVNTSQAASCPNPVCISPVQTSSYKNIAMVAYTFSTPASSAGTYTFSFRPVGSSSWMYPTQVVVPAGLSKSTTSFPVALSGQYQAQIQNASGAVVSNVSNVFVVTGTNNTTSPGPSPSPTPTPTMTVAAPVINNFSLSPTTTVAGNTSTLSWMISEYTSYSVKMNGAIYASSTSSSLTVSGTPVSVTVAPTSNTTYVLSVSNSVGTTVTQSLTLTVTPAPTPSPTTTSTATPTATPTHTVGPISQAIFTQQPTDITMAQRFSPVTVSFADADGNAVSPPDGSTYYIVPNCADAAYANCPTSNSFSATSSGGTATFFADQYISYELPTSFTNPLPAGKYSWKMFGLAGQSSTFNITPFSSTVNFGFDLPPTNVISSTSTTTTVVTVTDASGNPLNGYLSTSIGSVGTAVPVVGGKANVPLNDVGYGTVAVQMAGFQGIAKRIMTVVDTIPSGVGGLTLQGPVHYKAGDCSPYNVYVLDASGNYASSSISVLFFGIVPSTIGSGKFYSDANCTNQSTLFASDYYAGLPVYYQDNVTEATTVTVTALLNPNIQGSLALSPLTPVTPPAFSFGIDRIPGDTRQAIVNGVAKTWNSNGISIPTSGVQQIYGVTPLAQGEYDGDYNSTDASGHPVSESPIYGVTKYADNSGGDVVSAACVLKNAQVLCTGFNDEGGLGLGADPTVSTPSAPRWLNSQGVANPPAAYAPIVNVSKPVMDIASSDNSFCAIENDGSVWCWGSELAGELGNGIDSQTGIQSAPGQVQGLPAAAVSIVAGDAEYCATLSNGSVWCWGYLFWTTPNGSAFPYDRATPEQLQGLPGAPSKVALSPVGDQACAIVNGAAYCWGDNSFGELGILPAGAGISYDAYAENCSNCQINTPTLVAGFGSGVDDISPSDGTNCFHQNGVVKCLGDNSDNQLGTLSVANGRVADNANNTTDFTNTPHPVLVPGPILDIAESGNYSYSGINNTNCYLTSSAVYCSGYGTDGEFGPGKSNIGYYVPQMVAGLQNPIQLASYVDGYCVLLSGGNVSCWGDVLGQTNAMQTISGFSGPVAKIVTTGFTGGTCAVLQSGVVQCWSSTMTTPTTVSNLTGVSDLFYTSGYNYFAVQNGGVNLITILPSPLSLGTSTAIIAANSGVQSLENQCAHMSSGSIECFGRASNDSATITILQSPSLQAGATSGYVDSIRACSVASSGAFCSPIALDPLTPQSYDDPNDPAFGSASGMSTGMPYPVNISGLASGVKIKRILGSSGNCAIMTDGTAQCWGNNEYGRLGTQTWSYTPVTPDGI